MSAVLIVGGAGEFGSTLAKHLTDSQVVSVDLLLSSDSSRVKFGPLVKFDVRETPRVVRVAKEFSVSHLFHCAMMSNEDGSAVVIEQHLTTTMSLIQAARELKIGLTIFTPEGRTLEMITRIVDDCRTAGVANAEVISWAMANGVERAVARANSVV